MVEWEGGGQEAEAQPLIGRGFKEYYKFARNAPILVDPKSRTGGPLALSPSSSKARALQQFLDHAHSASIGTLESPPGSPPGSPAGPDSVREIPSLSSVRVANAKDRKRQRQMARQARRGSSASLRSMDTRSTAPHFRDMRETGMRDRRTLVDLRSVGGGDHMTEEAPMPVMPKACKGFRSTAHLRSEGFWDDLLEQLGQRVNELGPCRWVEEGWFKTLATLGIIGNALLVGCNHPTETVWKWFQPCIFLGLLELAVRVRRWRHKALRKHQPTGEALAVYIMDGVAVMGIATLLWGQRLGEALMLRTRGPDLAVSVLSLLRMARLVYIIPSLHDLAHGIMDAMQGLFWVLVLTFLLLYAIAIVCTRLIGHGEFTPGDDEEEAEGAHKVRMLFSTVSSSMFLLFQVMSAWSLQPLLPLFEVSRPAQIFFSAFYIFSGWTLLAVMTGTVSFTMIDMRSRLAGEDKEREADRRMNPSVMLRQVFESMDMDNSGEITKRELEEVLEMKEIRKLFATNTNIEPGDLVDLFSWVDNDHSGSVSFDEFLYGFRWLNDSFKTKNLLRLREKVTKDIRHLWRRMESTIQTSLVKLKSEVEAPVRKIHALSEQVQLAHSHAVDTAKVHEAPRAVADLELRVTEQIDDLVAVAERLIAERRGLPLPPLPQRRSKQQQQQGIVSQSLSQTSAQRRLKHTTSRLSSESSGAFSVASDRPDERVVAKPAPLPAGAQPATKAAPIAPPGRTGSWRPPPLERLDSTSSNRQQGGGSVGSGSRASTSILSDSKTSQASKTASVPAKSQGTKSTSLQPDLARAPSMYVHSDSKSLQASKTAAAAKSATAQPKPASAQKKGSADPPERAASVSSDGSSKVSSSSESTEDEDEEDEEEEGRQEEAPAAVAHATSDARSSISVKSKEPTASQPSRRVSAISATSGASQGPDVGGLRSFLESERSGASLPLGNKSVANLETPSAGSKVSSRPSGKAK